MTYLTALRRRTLPILAVLLCAGVAGAKDCPSGIEPATSADPTVSTEVLSYLVLPLTRCELEREAEAWLALVKDQVGKISDAEIAALAAAPEAATDAAPSATSAPRTGEVESTGESTGESATTGRAAILRQVNELVAQRRALIDRFEIVLIGLAEKGGDAQEYDKYIKAVSGRKVDVTDAGANLAAITDWLRSPDGGLRWAMNIIQFVVILLVFFILSVLVGKAAQRVVSRSKKITTLLRDFLVMGARRLVLFIGFFVGLSALEVNVGPVLAVIGAAGFVIAFALQNSLSNFASGILMLLYRPFDIGDFVNVASVVGKVESMNLLSTQLRTPDNQLLVVPNNSVWGDVITNITGITQRRVDLVFGIGYDDDIDKAQRILEDIVADHAKVLAEPKPVIRLHALADSSVNFICRPWVTPENYWDVYWDITREVKRRFDAEGVSIPFPQRDVHIYQEQIAAD